MLERLDAAADKYALGLAGLEPAPSLRGSHSARAAEVGLYAPVEELLGPALSGRDRAERGGIDERAQQPALGIGQDLRELSEVGDQCRAVEGAQPGSRVERHIEHSDIRVAHENLGVRADQLIVEQGQQVAGVVAADSCDDRAHIRVSEHGVDIAGPRLGRIREITALVAGVGREPRLKAQPLDLRNAALHAVGEDRRAAPRGAHNPDRIARPQPRRLRVHSVLLLLVRPYQRLAHCTRRSCLRALPPP